MVKTFGCERRNFGERLAGYQSRRQLGGDRDRHLDGLCFKAGLDCCERAIEPAEPVRDHGERVGHALGGFLMCLFLPGGKASADRPATSASARLRSCSTMVMVGFSPAAKSSSNRYFAGFHSH